MHRVLLLINAALLLAICVGIFLSTPDLVIITFLLIGGQTVLAMRLQPKGQAISLFHMFTFFNGVFFCLVPLFQYTLQEFKYIEVSSSRPDLIYVNIIVLCWNAFFFLGAYIAKRTSSFSGRPTITVTKRSFTSIIAIISIAFVVLFYAVWAKGWPTFFFRDSSPFQSEIAHTFYAFFFKPLIFFCFLLSYLRWCPRPFSRMIPSQAIWFCLALALNFPTATPRFYTLSLILALFAVFVHTSRNWLFYIVLTVGVFASMLFEFFRSPGGFTEIRPLLGAEYFSAGHFDAYELFVLGVRDIGVSGISWGKGFLSALLFFIPRSVWPTKGEASGQMIAERYIASFHSVENTNLSFPLVAECYQNFWLFGIIFGGIILGFIVSKLDSAFFGLSEAKNEYGRVSLALFGLLVGLFMFVLRGALLPSFAYSTGTAVAFFFALKVTGFRLRIHKSKYT